MASKQTCRELAAVPPERLGQRLSLFFADMASRVFDESREPNTAPVEAEVRDELVTPLQWMLFGGDPAVAFHSLEEHQTGANFCGKVFRGGEPAYFCKSVRARPREGVGMDWNHLTKPPLFSCLAVSRAYYTHTGHQIALCSSMNLAIVCSAV